MKTISKLYLTLVILTFPSCEKVINLDLPNSELNTLVVEGGIFHREDGASATQRIRLTTTQHFFDQTETPVVTNAIVSVNDDEQEVLFGHIGDGWYEAVGFVSEAGKTYTLSIQYQGQQYEAIEILPAVVSIEKIYTDFEKANPIFGDEDGHAVKLDFTDPTGKSNFYFWQLTVNGDYILEADAGNSANLLRKDDFFDGQQIIGLKTHEEFLAQVGDTAVLEQHAISSDFYDYSYAFFTLTGVETLLGDPPPSPLNGNVRNLSNPDSPALGYFQVSSVSVREIIVEE